MQGHAGIIYLVSCRDAYVLDMQFRIVQGSMGLIIDLVSCNNTLVLCTFLHHTVIRLHRYNFMSRMDMYHTRSCAT